MVQKSMAMFDDVVEEYSRSGGKILSCETVYDVPVGTANGNHSYGGICTLRHHDKKLNIMVCVDMMIGHRALKFGGGMFEEKLKKFIILNCYGG